MAYFRRLSLHEFYRAVRPRAEGIQPVVHFRRPGVEPGIAAPIGGEAHDDAGYRERAAYEIFLAFQRIV